MKSIHGRHPQGCSGDSGRESHRWRERCGLPDRELGCAQKISGRTPKFNPHDVGTLIEEQQRQDRGKLVDSLAITEDGFTCRTNGT